LNVVPARDDSGEQTAANVEAPGQPAEPSADKAASRSPVFSARSMKISRSRFYM